MFRIVEKLARKFVESLWEVCGKSCGKVYEVGFWRSFSRDLHIKSTEIYTGKSNGFYLKNGGFYTVST